MCGLVLTYCVRHNVTHVNNKERSHAHDREGIYECTATAQQVHIQCEGAWGVNIRERGEGWRGVLGVHEMLTQYAGLEVNVRTGIIHT